MYTSWLVKSLAEDRALLLGLGELAGRHAHATGGLHRPDPAVPAQHPDQGPDRRENG